MIIPISSLITYNGDEWEEYLEKICLIDIFKKIIEEFRTDKFLVTSIIKYIVWAYSLDSDKIVQGMEWESNKRKIYEDADMPVGDKALIASDESILTYYDAFVLLKYPTVLTTIKKWLDFQDDENWSNYCMYNDLLVEMRIAANSPIKKNTGEIDYEAKMKCAQSIKELIKMKQDAESSFFQNNDKMKQAYSEVSKELRKADKKVIGLETMINKSKS